VRGIRLRITLLAVGVVSIMLLAMAFALLGVQRRLLTDNLDEALTTRASALIADTNGDTGTIAPQGDDDSIVQITTLDGDVLAATANFAAQTALSPPLSGDARHLRTARLIPGEPPYRILSVRTDATIIYVASPTDDIDEGIAALRIALAGTIPIAALSLAVLIWWLIGRTLRPVEAIRAEVANITGHNLHRRVPEPTSNDEIQRLANTMNAMLDRVERSTDAQRRFVADASHELRSPLTRIRSEVEVDLAHPDTAEFASTHRSVAAEVTTMQQLIDDLLTLARLDSPQPFRPPRELVDLEAIVRREVQRQSPTPSLQIDAMEVTSAQVMGDSRQLARAVRNLLDNATRHATSIVTVSLYEHDAFAVVTVTDDGPGVPLGHRESIFERFTRVDDARSQRAGGAGLGLAITRSIIELHHGTIALEDSYQRGARFIVHLPLAPDTPHNE
jgi:signal transduction histidine kinase